jgi:hypothetical protein
MKHAMIDLETLGTTPQSIFMSIAAVQFNPDSGAVGKHFACNVDLQSSIDVGRKWSSSTLQWWLTQRKDIMLKMFNAPVPLATALREFKQWIEENGIIFVWGNSASFDVSMLVDAFNQLGIAVPWKYNNERCYRTISKEFDKFLDEVFPYPEDAHDPLVDCMYQVTRLNHIYRRINFHKYQDSQFETDYGVAVYLLHDMVNAAINNSGNLTPALVDNIKKFLDGVSLPPRKVVIEWQKRVTDENINLL